MRWRLARKLLDRVHRPPYGPQLVRLRRRANLLPLRQRQKWRNLINQNPRGWRRNQARAVARAWRRARRRLFAVAGVPLPTG